MAPEQQDKLVHMVVWFCVCVCVFACLLLGWFVCLCGFVCAWGVLGGVASGIFGVELLRWLSLLRGAWATSWPKLRFLALPGSLKSANGGRRRSSGFGACGAGF